MIIGTAGHIDHGKTALVQALTGVDTDRLKEEKARGITIELGYAYQPLPNGEVLGFIDVPGHERLVHTMLAGAAGIDFLLLVVAADDGLMPQTHEHLRIAELLGLARGAVALTKIDRVDADQIAAVSADIAALLATGPLAGLPVFPVSALDGTGIEPLRRHLHAVGTAFPPRATLGRFRLAVDRCFTLHGAGTLVTGTVFAGEVRVGDEVCLLPGGRRVRVRGLHAQNRPAELGRAGQRCALNLAGIDKDAIARGDWILDPALALPVERFDACLHLSPQAPRPLRQWTPVHLHLGAAHRMAHLVRLDGDQLAPGERGWVQLVPERPLGALYGDRFILRDAEARQTLGGGRVLDIRAPARRRRTPERLAELAALACAEPAERLARLLEHAEFGIDPDELERAWNQPDLCAHLPADCRLIRSGGETRVLTLAAWEALERRLLDGLAEHHVQSPDELGPDAARARRRWLPRLPAPVFETLVAGLIERGALQRTGAWLHRPEHDLRLTPAEQAVAERILTLLRASPLEPPWVRDIARTLGREESEVRRLLRRLGGQGQVFQVVRDLFFLPETLDRFVEVVRDLEREQGGARAADFRDRTGLGRKRAIQILEYFDRLGFTRRFKDVHRVRPDSPLAAPGVKIAH